jgi:hypothetical protein
VKRVSGTVFPLTLVLVSIQPLSAQVQGQWANTATMQSARELNAQLRLVSGRVLSIGGADNNGNLLALSDSHAVDARKWQLEPGKNWSQASSLGFLRH